MPKITFLPMNITVKADPGKTILDIALDNDIDIQHACGGNCACSTCTVKLIEGELSPKDEDREGIFVTEDNERLACQAKVMNNDVTVEIID